MESMEWQDDGRLHRAAALVASDARTLERVAAQGLRRALSPDRHVPAPGRDRVGGPASSGSRGAAAAIARWIAFRGPSGRCNLVEKHFSAGSLSGANAG